MQINWYKSQTFGGIYMPSIFQLIKGAERKFAPIFKIL